MGKPPLIVICGPTASGKTACAVELCKQIGGEVVSADSMQLYKGMNIGTAKPTAAEMQGIPHHLIDVISASERFSVAAYAECAKAAICQIGSRDRMPVLCGGTGLYINAVTKPMHFSDIQGGGETRAELEAQSHTMDGRASLHQELAQIDPETAAKLHLNDVRRVIRAIEVYRLTGKRVSDTQKEDQAAEGDYEVTMFGLNWPRDVLYSRINLRVDQMIEEGLIDEVKSLEKSGALAGSTARQALGYKEILSMLRGDISQADAIEMIKQGTRNYAKRQMTWFRRDQRVNWINADEHNTAGDISREILQMIDLRRTRT